MSRTIKEIYQEAVTERNKRLELNEFESDSKLSIMNGITWMVAAIIYTFEALLDTFVIDISEIIKTRINGTAPYYVQLLLKYQRGDTVSVSSDGLNFGYNSIDETKRIISHVSYTESTDDYYLDKKTVYKVATGEKGNLSAVSPEELVVINSYLQNFVFAGTRVEVISRSGDVLIPRVTVFYDGAIPESEMYDNIVDSLNEYIMNMNFDSSVYVSQVLDAIKKVEHVTDVYIDPKATPEQGIFMASYDSDGYLKPTQKIDRIMHTSSGFLKESTKEDQEKDLPNFKEAIKLEIDKR